MRRLKAIYLIPVFLILLIGAAFAGHHFIIVPQVKKVATAQEEWKKAKEEAEKMEGEYQGHIDREIAAAKQTYNEYYIFHQIQNTMPNILNMAEVYADPRKREGLVRWYIILGKNLLAQELKAWARGFRLKPPDIKFEGLTLGFEDSLPGIKLVEMDFDKQQFTAAGYTKLCNLIQEKSGYGFFPLIITPLGREGAPGSILITIDQTRPYRESARVLQLSYSAKAYFMTRGWDPNGATAKDDVAKAQTILESPPQMEPPRSGPDKPCPPVLWIFEAKGLQ
jgi:hypothetical protein